jgi:chloramphenicol 3-O phosphotransferase
MDGPLSLGLCRVDWAIPKAHRPLVGKAFVHCISILGTKLAQTQTARKKNWVRFGLVHHFCFPNLVEAQCRLFTHQASVRFQDLVEGVLTSWLGREQLLPKKFSPNSYLCQREPRRKSSTAAALQAIASKPFLYVAMDAFLEMLPKKLLTHPEGLLLERMEDDGKPIIGIRTGPVLQRAMRGMRCAVAAMAAQGNNLIVDEVMIAADAAQEYRDLLQSVDLYLVGLFASLDVLEARERGRGDREIGLARWQYGRVHRGIVYDLEVDTTSATPAECALQIQSAFRL